MGNRKKHLQMTDDDRELIVACIDERDRLLALADQRRDAGDHDGYYHAMRDARRLTVKKIAEKFECSTHYVYELVAKAREAESV